MLIRILSRRPKFNVINFSDRQTEHQTDDKKIVKMIEWYNLTDIRPDAKGLVN